MKQISDQRIIILLCFLALALVISACGAASTAPPTAPPPSPTSVPTATPTPESTIESGTDEVGAPSINVPALELATRVSEVATAVALRTPKPTPTPGVIDRVVVDLVDQTGLTETSFLRLRAKDWIDLVVSALILGLVLLIILPLLSKLLTWLVQRTPTRFDDEFLELVKRQLIWLVVVIIAQFAILRLDFLGDWLNNLVQDVAYVLTMGLLAMIVLRFINFSTNWLLEYLVKDEGPSKRLRPLITIFKWLIYLFVLLIVVTLVAAHFGFNITLLVPSFLFLLLILGVLGVAAQSALTDAISGILILADEPFQRGDIIHLPQLDMSGEVISIGLRTTRIRTGDNRRIIVPNSELGESAVINYSLPDPSHRSQVDFVVVGESFEQLELIIVETVRAIEGVLPDKPVDVHYLSFGGTGREIRVGWWVESVSSHLPVQTKVLVALEKALDVAGIETPNLTYDLNVQQIKQPPNASENHHISRDGS
ncbi:MAG: mechanosensitive ion channel [Chloroflexi bacterium]|jgi:small-conductance mechanosensitive channel|nr:mechanosensitive ion channel [Chloroflexota bacterium]